MGIRNKALCPLTLGVLLAALAPATPAADQAIDRYTVLHPDGRGGAVIDQPASEAARAAGRVQAQRFDKKHPPAVYPLWDAKALYAAGSVVYHQGSDYKALMGHSGIVPTNAIYWRRQRPDHMQNNGIFYHGGPVMSAPVAVYYIWYGNWSQHARTREVLRSFVQGLGDTPAWNVNTTYYDSDGARVSRHLFLAGEASDDYSQGGAMNEEGWAAVVANAIKRGRVPLSDKAVYIVLTSRDVQDTSGYSSCGRHDHFELYNQTIKYAMVPDPAISAPSGCGMNSPSPNGDSSGDAMASMVYHELSAIATDPTFSSRFDDSGPDPASPVMQCAPVGFESADKCLWNYGPTRRDANGALYNQSFGGRNYLLQQMWINGQGGRCVQRP